MPKKLKYTRTIHLCIDKRRLIADMLDDWRKGKPIGYINVPGENTFIDKLIAVASHKKPLIVMADCNRTDKDGRCRGHRVLKESE